MGPPASPALAGEPVGPLWAGLVAGITRRYRAVATLLIQADSLAPSIAPALAWQRGLPLPPARRWAIILDAVAAMAGCQITCLPQRRSTVGLEQVLRRALVRAGASWETMSVRIAPIVPGDPTTTALDLVDAVEPCRILDHIAVLGHVAPVLTVASYVSPPA